MVDLRLGDYLKVLDDVEVDATIVDSPYGAATHKGHDAGVAQCHDGADRRVITYDHWTPDDVRTFVRWAHHRTRGWIVAMTSDDLAMVYREAYEEVGRYHFTAVVIRQPRVRQVGDGPASEAIYMMVSRPKTIEFSRWGALPGWYDARVERSGHIGGKPLGLMRSVVGHYTMPGDTVCDPCAGFGTTLVAALELGCGAVGAELDPPTWKIARARLEKPRNILQHPRLTKSMPKAEQGVLL